MRGCNDGPQLRTRPPAGLAVAAAVNGARATGALGAAFARKALRYAGQAPHDASESTCVDVEVRPAHTGAITLHKASLGVCGVTICKSWTLGFLRRQSVDVLFPCWEACTAHTIVSSSLYQRGTQLASSCLLECHSVSATTGDRWQAARGGGERS